MICPGCKSDMTVVEYNKIELDYCTRCQGVWFDSGELELLLKSMSLEDPNLFFASIRDSKEAASSEKKQRCPICGQKMKKTTIAQQREILIDVCPQGDGLWFDGGELAQLVKQMVKQPLEEPDSQRQVIAFLGEVFKARE
jgi:hypothetical protein